MEHRIDEVLREVWPEWKSTERIGKGSFSQVYRVERSDFAGVSQAAMKVIVIPDEE